MTRTAPAKGVLDVDALRAEYPSLRHTIGGKSLVYLDNACTALKPKVVADRMHEVYLDWGGCGGKRSTHLLSQQMETWSQEARQTVVDYINADNANEIVFTSGTTEAINLVARGLPIEGARREVIISDLEHNSLFLPFYESAQRGEIDLRYCPSKEGRIDLTALEAMVSKKTALVALTRASNVFGGTQPAAEISRLVRRQGSLLLMDEAQFLSSHREDVQASNVDFAAFSAHKIGGPFGVGVLFGREQLLNGLGHYKVGGGSVKTVLWPEGKDPEVTYLDAPMRFEAGVQNLAGWVGFGEALRFLEKLPADSVRAHVGALVRRAALGLAAIPQVRVLGDLEDLAQGSLVSFYPVHKDFSVADFNLYLNHELGDHFIAIRAGEHCAHLLHQRLGIEATLRLSFFAYNTEGEVDQFLDALQAYIREACA